MPKCVLPIDPPASASETEKRIWEKKCDSYAKTVTAAYNLLTNWKQDPRNMMRAIGPVHDGLSFTNFTSTEEDRALATQSKRVAKDKTHVTCFKYKGTGHYANECTSEEATSESMLMTGIANGEFNQDNYGFHFNSHSKELVTHC